MVSRGVSVSGAKGFVKGRIAARICSLTEELNSALAAIKNERAMYTSVTREKNILQMLANTAQERRNRQNSLYTSLEEKYNKLKLAHRKLLQRSAKKTRVKIQVRTFQLCENRSHGAYVMKIVNAFLKARFSSVIVAKTFLLEQLLRHQAITRKSAFLKKFKKDSQTQVSAMEPNSLG
jgi:hypothetical protein